MLYRLLADAVIVVHFTFIVFVVLGGLLAWWLPRLRWIHLASVAYGAGIVLIGWSCPLTALERRLWDAGGETAPTDGFVDRFLEGVIYPGDHTSSMRVLAGLVIAASWIALLWRHRRDATHWAAAVDARDVA